MGGRVCALKILPNAGQCTRHERHMIYCMSHNMGRSRYIIWAYGCFQKQGYPQIIHFNRVFHYKPSILGTPILGNIHIPFYFGFDQLLPQLLRSLLKWPSGILTIRSGRKCLALSGDPWTHPAKQLRYINRSRSRVFSISTGGGFHQSSKIYCHHNSLCNWLIECFWYWGTFKEIFQTYHVLHYFR